MPLFLTNPFRLECGRKSQVNDVRSAASSLRTELRNSGGVGLGGGEEPFGGWYSTRYVNDVIRQMGECHIVADIKRVGKSCGIYIGEVH